MKPETLTATPTRTLAKFVADATFDDLPPRIVEAAKLYILDSIANQIGGATMPHGQIALQLFGEMGGKPESTILATGNKTACLLAVYVNAALNNSLDFDDCYLDIAHPGATIVPAALGVGEKVGASGKQFLNAVVVGYEVSLRICDAIQPTPERFYWAPSMASWQIFGAATAAAKLLRLGPEQVATVFGHAGQSAPVPFRIKMGLYPEERPFSQLKNNFGWSAMGGVLAAELAGRGLRGNRTMFDQGESFWAMAGSDQCDFDRFTSGLGEEYLMPVTGFKPYGACRQTHSTLDAVHELIAEHPIDPRRIDHILVESITSVYRNFDVRTPAHVVDAQFSVPPLVALTLAGHSPSHGIATDHLQDELVKDLIAKVELRVGPDADEIFRKERHIPSTVTIRMDDGTVYRRTRREPTGDPGHPISPERLKMKFLELTTPVVGEGRARQILGRVERLETLSTIGELTA